jgi:hypothetical protein
MRLVAATALLICLPLCAAVADIYRSVDAQGHVQYSDTPSPGAELITSSAEIRPESTTSTSAESTSKSRLLQESQHVSATLATQAAQQEVEREVSALHRQQCKQAQQVYQQSIQARRIYKVGPGGERNYLTDDEADQQRVNNRLAMEAACQGVSDAGDNAAGDNTSSDAAGGASDTAGGGSSAPNP